MPTTSSEQSLANTLETHVILSHRVGLSKQEDIEPIISSLREESRMIIAMRDRALA